MRVHIYACTPSSAYSIIRIISADHASHHRPARLPRTFRPASAVSVFEAPSFLADTRCAAFFWVRTAWLERAAAPLGGGMPGTQSLISISVASAWPPRLSRPEHSRIQCDR